MNANAGALPEWNRVLVVVAHPDDESFGLGAVIDAMVASGSTVDVLCLSAGEASTLGVDAGADLTSTRAAELAEAANRLGVSHTTLLDYPDGALSARVDELVDAVRATVLATAPDGLLAFDVAGGVTGHPDHHAATLATEVVARERQLPVAQWCLPADVADTLNREFGAAFVGYPETEIPIAVTVDRAQQHRAIAAHASQAVPGSVLWRRLELLGERECLRLTLP